MKTSTRKGKQVGLSTPVAGSRGRNGDFTAVTLEVGTEGLATAGSANRPAYVVLDAYSRRSAGIPPVRLILSAHDAVVLGETLLATVEAILQDSAVHIAEVSEVPPSAP